VFGEKLLMGQCFRCNSTSRESKDDDHLTINKEKKKTKKSRRRQWQQHM
jgi:hypothetical protein